jgi:hypothetical protein
MQEDGMRRLRLTLAVVAILALAFAAVTLAALEGNEVVIVRTRAGDGNPHTTRTWIAEADGVAWIEAANPERPFLHDLERDPQLELERAGGVLRCRAAIVPNPEGHERIRVLLASRYGWADWWIGLIADTRRSVAVRLDCA